MTNASGDSIRFEIAMARRMLALHGCDSGVAGHVSARAPGEDAFYVTPFELFEETTPDRVIKVSFDLELLEGSSEPSPAIQFHGAFYRARPDVNSVIHTHALYTTVLAATGRPLGMYNDLSCLFFEEQVIHVDDGSTPPVIGPVLVAAAGADKRVVLLRNHGVIILAESLLHATVDAFSFEKAAHIQIEVEAVGGVEHSDAYARASKQAYRRSWYRQTWEAAARRVQREWPELFLHDDELPVT